MHVKGPRIKEVIGERHRENDKSQTNKAARYTSCYKDANRARMSKYGCRGSMLLWVN
jgi:hypothetical protein